jgi:dihydrofolate reductase
MRKLIAAINMTLDGFCDHTAITPDEEVHDHYTELLNSGDTIIYGRITYQLMEDYWPAAVKNPTGNKAMDEFAVSIDNISKVVFSHTLKNVEWKNARLAKRGIKEEISALKQEPGRDIFVGSPGLIIASMNLHLVDEYQFTIHPVVVGAGLPLFKNISDRMELKLVKTKTFVGGAITLYYEPANACKE